MSSHDWQTISDMDDSINIPRGGIGAAMLATHDELQVNESLYEPLQELGAARPALDVSMACETDERVEPIHGSITESVPPPAANDLNNKRFSHLIERSSQNPDNMYDPLNFYADKRFTPIEVENGIYHILSSAPGLLADEFETSFALVNHGTLTHSWSLIKNHGRQRSAPILRPIAILETSGKGVGNADAIITDFASPLEAQKITITHFYDSFAQGGTHVGFRVNNDLFYEWRQVEYPPASGNIELYLWQHQVEGSYNVVPAARLIRQSLVHHPLKPSSFNGLWSLELDLDRVPPHLALASAFSFKATHARFHAWFASKKTIFKHPFPFVNYAFQDEGRVIQRSSKFWGDWLDSLGSEAGVDEDPDRITLVRVFNRAFLQKHLLPSEVIEMLGKEAQRQVAFLRMTASIY